MGVRMAQKIGVVVCKKSGTRKNICARMDAGLPFSIYFLHTQEGGNEKY